MITFDFHGTSHGEGYHGVIKGVPSGYKVSVNYVNQVLALRKCGPWRSSRQTFVDKVEFLGHENDVEFVTDGNDITFFVANSCVEKRADITAVRSGHADLVGQKRHPEMTAREIAEIASARSSLCYVVLGAICKEILQEFGIQTDYFVEQIGNVVACHKVPMWQSSNSSLQSGVFPCYDEQAREQMLNAIHQAQKTGNSLGGVVCVTATVPMGLGEIFPYEKRLDAQLAGHLAGIPSVKGVSFGIGCDYASSTGVDCHDQLWCDDDQIKYKTNKCGGIVGGITTGNQIVINLVVKPLPTVKGVQTVDTKTHQVVDQHYERADSCVVPTVGLVAQHIVNYVLANQVLKQHAENPKAFPKIK